MGICGYRPLRHWWINVLYLADAQIDNLHRQIESFQMLMFRLFNFTSALSAWLCYATRCRLRWRTSRLLLTAFRWRRVAQPAFTAGPICVDEPPNGNNCRSAAEILTLLQRLKLPANSHHGNHNLPASQQNSELFLAVPTQSTLTGAR